MKRNDLNPCTFWQNRPARRYFTATAALCALLPALGALAGWAAVQWAQRQWAARLAGLASALLAQGLTPGQAAAALANPQPTAAGAALAAQMAGGPALPAAPGVLAAALCALLPALALAALCLHYLNGREQAAAAALQAVQRYTAGDFTTRLPARQTGTPGRLWAAVDELATALQAQGEAQRRSKEFLQNTISDISHQLKTPLAALALYNDILAAEPENAAAVRQFTQKTAASLERMTALVQMLLKLARLDAGGIVFEPACHPVAALAARAAEPLQARAAAEGKALTLQGDPATALYCDAAWTVEAVGNLIKNAIDHTGPGGHIAVAWHTAPGQLRLTVTDDGCGIAPGDLHHIFKRFYRAPHTAPTVPGVGLGLPLAKAILEGQGGVLTVESEPGQGSTFTAAFYHE